MIIRKLFVRQGRQALAAPVARCCLRTFSTAPTQTTASTTTLPSISEQTPESQAAEVAQLLEAEVKKLSASIRKLDIKDIPEQFSTYKQVQRHTRNLGSEVEVTYDPDDVLTNPPHDATLEMLMAAQAHMGHNTSLWNPANARYIYGERAGIHIISLETVAAHLRRAARVVEEVAYNGGLILFVGTRPGQMPIVVRAAELAGACHLFQKWTPGTITNRDQILAGAQLQIVDANDQPVPGFDSLLQECRPVVPDLVVCLNPRENYTMLYECGQAGVPTIGVIDTDADPTWVTYQIPANDDSLRAMSLVAGVLGRAGERGQIRRRTAAENGICTWENPGDVEHFMKTQSKRRAAAVKDSKEGKEEATREDFEGPRRGRDTSEFRSIM